MQHEEPQRRRLVLKFRCNLLATEDELIYLMIDGLTYIYCLDKAKHPYFIKTLKYKPGKAINYIKAEAYWTEMG